MSASALAIRTVYSFERSRKRFSQPNVRSTTQRRAKLSLHPTTNRISMTGLIQPSFRHARISLSKGSWRLVVVLRSGTSKAHSSSVRSDRPEVNRWGAWSAFRYGERWREEVVFALGVESKRIRDSSEYGEREWGDGPTMRVPLGRDTGTLSKTEPKRHILYQQQTPDGYSRESDVRLWPSCPSEQLMNR